MVVGLEADERPQSSQILRLLIEADIWYATREGVLMKRTCSSSFLLHSTCRQASRE